jgi:hypothetical protein
MCSEDLGSVRQRTELPDWSEKGTQLHLQTASLQSLSIRDKQAVHKKQVRTGISETMVNHGDGSVPGGLRCSVAARDGWHTSKTWSLQENKARSEPKRSETEDYCLVGEGDRGRVSVGGWQRSWGAV